MPCSSIILEVTFEIFSVIVRYPSTRLFRHPDDPDPGKMDKKAPSKDVTLPVLSTWARIRLRLKEPFAEFLGTCMVSCL